MAAFYFYCQKRKQIINPVLLYVSLPGSLSVSMSLPLSLSRSVSLSVSLLLSVFSLFSHLCRYGLCVSLFPIVRPAIWVLATGNKVLSYGSLPYDKTVDMGKYGFTKDNDKYR